MIRVQTTHVRRVLPPIAHDASKKISSRTTWYFSTKWPVCQRNKPSSRVIPVPRTPGPLDVVRFTQSALLRSKIQDPTSFTTHHQPVHVLLARINPLSALSVWPTESNTRPRIQMLTLPSTSNGKMTQSICRYQRCLAPTSRYNPHEVIAPSSFRPRGLRVKPVACGRNQTSEHSTKVCR